LKEELFLERCVRVFEINFVSHVKCLPKIRFFFWSLACLFVSPVEFFFFVLELYYKLDKFFSQFRLVQPKLSMDAKAALHTTFSMNFANSRQQNSNYIKSLFFFNGYFLFFLQSIINLKNNNNNNIRIKFFYYFSLKLFLYVLLTDRDMVSFKMIEVAKGFNRIGS
jgi:hypothetical protein